MAGDSKYLAKSLLSAWLLEETSGNLSAYELIAPNTVLIVSLKDPGILAGIPHVEALVEHFDCIVEWHLTEGAANTANQKVATVYGAPSDLVRCEPLVKTILSRASSIATYAKKFKDLLSELSWKGELVSPFVNTPGFALVEENAMFAAGVPSSRKPSSLVLPAGHVIAAGGISQAITSIRTRTGSNASITLECSTYELAVAGAKNGANCVRFINLNAKDLEKYSKLLKTVKPSLIIEASVDLDELNLKDFALPSVDVLTSPKLFNGFPTIEVVLRYEVLKDSEQIQKHKAASASLKSPDNNGSAKMTKVAGSKAIPAKRQRTDSPPSASSASQQPTKPNTSSSSAKRTGSNFNRPGNRNQSCTPGAANRSQYYQQTHDSRRMTPSFRPAHQSLMNPGAGVNRNPQQQQVTDAFLQQTRVMTLMGQQPQPRHEDLMSQSQHQQPWHSLMGASPSQQSFSCVCHNCRLPYFQGQSYCSNCKAQLR
nr:quinolinate phosphoribosyltransferase [Hymenolepis microstoma]